MGRGYSRDAYLSLVDHVRTVLPGVSISSDFISGFCGETDADHRDTISLMEHVRYDQVTGCYCSTAPRCTEFFFLVYCTFKARVVTCRDVLLLGVFVVP